MIALKRLTVLVCVTVLLAGCGGVAQHQKTGAGYTTYEQAVAEYRGRYQADPSNLSALVGLSRNLRYARQPQRALDALETAPAALRDHPAYLTEKGKVYLAAGDYGQAKALLEDAVARSEGNWEAWSALGITFDFLGDYQNAAAAYRQAASICPQSASILNNYGLSTALSGELVEAKTLLAQATALRPHSQQIRNNLALVARTERVCPRCSHDQIASRLGALITSPDWSHGDLACTVGSGEIVETLSHADFIDMKVEFAFDSADLTRTAMATLDQLGMALSDAALQQGRFRLEGHTDAVGAERYNQALSERRARAVKTYLVDVLGIDAARLETVGFGESQLLDPANPESGENRRVRVVKLR